MTRSLLPPALAGALLAAAFGVAPALAVGGGDGPPTPTPTTTECPRGQIWDTERQACVEVRAGLDEDLLYDAVRELAYAGRNDEALAVLDVMAGQTESRVLNYRGFLLRRTGNMEAGMEAYVRALAADPDNILARSYMGQALVLQGNRHAARQQLDEIRARGGAGSWAEAALVQALETGAGSDY